jgi:hypothetical protein
LLKDNRFLLFSTRYNHFNLIIRAHLNEQIDNIYFTIASQPDANSSRGISSDISDKFITGTFDDLAENIYVHLQIMH